MDFKNICNYLVSPIIRFKLKREIEERIREIRFDSDKVILNIKTKFKNNKIDKLKHDIELASISKWISWSYLCSKERHELSSTIASNVYNRSMHQIACADFLISYSNYKDLWKVKDCIEWSNY